MDPDEKGIGPSDQTWVSRREKLVQQAIHEEDLGRLRELAALPGGFGSNEMRKRVWPILLGTGYYHDRPVDEGFRAMDAAQRPTSPVDNNGDATTHHTRPHKEEEQVLKDTNRSFVSYPKGLPSESKEALQADLQDLIMGVLKRHPALSYFQGYHDILSVLYLTYIPLPERPDRSTRSRQVSRAASVNGGRSSDGNLVKTEGNKSKIPEAHDGRHVPEWCTLRQCADVVSLCRVRDAMGPGMEAMMGYLRILKRVLKAADPELSRFSSLISPVPTLPFFALSWILTLFSHDVNTLEPIQRMFDYLLSRNPISAIYLAVAILIAKKPQMLRLIKMMGQEAMDDPSILHPLFSRLPPLVADNPGLAPASQTDECSRMMTEEKVRDNDVNPYHPIALSAIFGVADDLMARYPWDGPVIRGLEVFGNASSVVTFSLERNPDWSLSQAEELVLGEVVKPGAGMMDDDDDVEERIAKINPVRRRLRLRLHLPQKKIGTFMAVGVVLVGIGIAVYGTRSGGPRSNWTRWWSVVLRDVVSGRGSPARHLTDVFRTWAAKGSTGIRRALAGLFDY